MILGIGIPFTVLMAQPDQKIKVHIRLKNNERVHGWLSPEDIPILLSVYKTDQDSIAVPTKFIEKITFEKDNEVSNPEIAYFNNTFIGILTGRSNSQSTYRSRITVEMVNGVRLNSFCWPGLGIAYDQYPEVNILPFFMSIRGDLMKHRITPFYFLDMGSGPAWDQPNQDFVSQDAKGGLMYHIGGGIKVYSDSRLNVILAAGFKSQRVKFTRVIWGDQQEVINRNYKNFSFRIGIGF